ncbi:MAG: prepilin-type N-terminal cleavage/methylation domain-containing protein [Sulfurovum sp.]|nr:prepilin-type N-terminal cleavage/methylation domain-containing protein [Sulfurovum sp.]
MIHFNLKNRPAFTMIELVFVIVVLGILASLAMPRLDRDLKQEAADSILSDIRYTQHLALVDNMHEYDDVKWQQKFWRVVFSNCGSDLFYMVGSDTSKDDSLSANFALEEAATDPTNGKPMFNSCGTDNSAYSERIFITNKYGITAVAASNACSNNNSNKYIGFDHLGRPHYGFSAATAPDYSSHITSTCTFTFTMSDGDTFGIEILPETGYAQIVGQDAS